MVCDKHAKEEFILSTTGRTTTTVYDRGRQPRPPWHCDANREDHMTELDHEVVKGLCDRMNTIHGIYKKSWSLLLNLTTELWNIPKLIFTSKDSSES